MRADLVARIWFQHDLDLVLDVDHAVQRQHQSLLQIDRLVLRHQLETVGGLGVVDTAVDGHEHEGVSIANVQQTHFHAMEQVLKVRFGFGFDILALILFQHSRAVLDIIRDDVDTRHEGSQRLQEKQTIRSDG